MVDHIVTFFSGYLRVLEEDIFYLYVLACEAITNILRRHDKKK